jgi:hypothetical protein
VDESGRQPEAEAEHGKDRDDARDEQPPLSG